MTRIEASCLHLSLVLNRSFFLFFFCEDRIAFSSNKWADYSRMHTNYLISNEYIIVQRTSIQWKVQHAGKNKNARDYLK